jgi:hypothetical protein
VVEVALPLPVKVVRVAAVVDLALGAEGRLASLESLKTNELRWRRKSFSERRWHPWCLNPISILVSNLGKGCCRLCFIAVTVTSRVQEMRLEATSDKPRVLLLDDKTIASETGAKRLALTGASITSTSGTPQKTTNAPGKCPDHQYPRHSCFTQKQISDGPRLPPAPTDRRILSHLTLPRGRSDCGSPACMNKTSVWDYNCWAR